MFWLICRSIHSEKLLLKKLRAVFKCGNTSSHSQTEGRLVFEKELRLHDGASSYNENLILGFIIGLSLAADSAREKPS